MADVIKVGDIYDKHLNFLIGSGASYGLFPTLALKIKDEAETSQTIETLATRFEKAKDAARYGLLFMHYYRTCIRPVCQFTLADVGGNPVKQQVLDNYETFIQTRCVSLIGVAPMSGAATSSPPTTMVASRTLRTASCSGAPLISL